MFGEGHDGYHAARSGLRNPAHTRTTIVHSGAAPTPLISNRQIPRLETHLTLAKSASKAFLIAKISQISNSHFAASFPLPLAPLFLIDRGGRLEIAVSNSKQRRAMLSNRR